MTLPMEATSEKKVRTFRMGLRSSRPSRLSIEAHDLSWAECQALRAIVCNNQTDSEDYRARKEASPFLQGFRLPSAEKGADGWILVEFWSFDHQVIQAYVTYINRVFAERVELCKTFSFGGS